jgi:hypothetical protein
MPENANSRITGPLEGWVSRFGSAPNEIPTSAWSEEQKRFDDHKVEMLAHGLLRIHDQRPGKGTTAEKYYAISRTTVAQEATEILPGCEPAHELIGGFVTREEALLEFPQPPITEVGATALKQPSKQS